MAMSSMFALPLDVLAQNVFAYLELKDIARLDTSVTNKVLRPHFLQCLQQTSLVTTKKSKRILLVELQWLATKSIKGVTSLNVSFDAIDPKFSDRFVNLISLTIIRGIQPVTLTAVIELALELPRLRHLVMNGFLIDESEGKTLHLPLQTSLRTVRFISCAVEILNQHVEQLASCSPELEAIQVRHCESWKNISLQNIYSHCPKLQRLEISCNVIKVPNRWAPGLMHLLVPHLEFTNESLHALVVQCSQLIRLHITSSQSSLTMQCMESLAQHCAHLTSLKICRLYNFIADIGVQPLMLNLTSLTLQ